MPGADRLPAKLASEERGAALLEFALLFPLFIFMLLGALDMGHTLYAKAVLQGEMQRAGRQSGLDMNSGEASQADLDENVRKSVKTVSANANVTFVRTAYHSYELAQAKTEPFVDTNKNSACDAGESYQDTNLNSRWDPDSGKTGQGGGKDVVIYTATATYPRLFPMATLAGWSDDVTLTATTILRNQPFENQADPVIRRCA